MARNDVTESDAGNADHTASPTDAAIRRESEEPSTATVIATEDDAGDSAYPNELTIVGRGVPSSFEITIDGDIDGAEDVADATVVSGSTIEGTIETGTVGFRFDGELTDVTFVDRSISGRSPGTLPNVHVNYGAGD